MRFRSQVLRAFLFLVFVSLSPAEAHAGGQVTAWGYYYDLTMPETYRPMYIPAGLTNVLSVSGGAYHALALKADGNVVAWGWNGNGGVPLGLSNAVSVAAGFDFSLALKNDGQVIGWGYSGYGAENVPAGLSNVSRIAAGSSFSSALKTDGTLWVWGGGLSGPPALPPGLSNVTAISAGGSHLLALKNDGTVIACGWNSSGQTNVPAALRRVIQVAAGQSHSLALLTDGTVAGWGSGPASTVPAGLSNVISIAAGWGHNLALRDDGSVVAWGAGTNYVPDYSINKGQSVVPPGLAAVSSLAGGSTFSLGITNASGPPVIQAGLINETVGEGAKVWMPFVVSGTQPVSYQWQHNGTNIPGATGYRLFLDNVDPSDSGTYSVVASNALGVASNLCSLAVVPLLITTQPQSGSIFLGSDIMFSVEAEGSGVQFQWRFNGIDLIGQTNNTVTISNAQFGDIGSYSVVVSNSQLVVTSSTAGLLVKQVAVFEGDPTLPPNLTNVIAIAAGSLHRLVLQGDGTVVAWGQSSLGQTNVPASASNIVAIAAGGYHNLALRENGSVIGWGYNNAGQTDVPVDLNNVVAIAAGTYHSLALKEDGTVVGWGNYYGDAGYFPVPAGLSKIVAISAGGYTSAALDANGRLVVWGINYYGQTNVPPSLTNVVAISVGGDGNVTHLLALTSDSTVTAWGYSGYGQTSVPDGLSSVVAVAGGDTISMALKSDGKVVIWSSWSSTSIPPGVQNVIVIARDMALVGHGPPVTKAPLITPIKASSTFRTSLPTQSGHVFVLEFKDTVTETGWTALPLVAGSGGLLWLVDSTATNSQRVYRVRRW